MLGGFRDSGMLGGISRDLRIQGATGHNLSTGRGFRRAFSVLGALVGVLEPVVHLLEGRLGSNSCKAFCLLFFLARQELQVTKTLPVEVVEKQDSRRFWRQLEQYLESI